MSMHYELFSVDPLEADDRVRISGTWTWQEAAEIVQEYYQVKRCTRLLVVEPCSRVAVAARSGFWIPRVENGTGWRS